MIKMMAFADFDTASRAVLECLQKRLGFGLWMMTRVEGDDWIVLQAEDHSYGVKDGAVFRWADSFCTKMVDELGPRVAPRAQDIPVYAAAPIGQQISIGAYFGVPIVKSDGSLFGTLCAIDPGTQRDSIVDELPLVELFAKLLGTILERELTAIDQSRKLELSLQEALLDGLTGLLNRKGWDYHIVIEEARAKRYGTPLSIFIVDLDDLKKVNDSEGHAQGDMLIRKTAGCLRASLRSSDIVARIGGDEFAILAIDCNKLGAKILNTKITNALASQNIRASVGNAARESEKGISGAMHDADQNMYTVKAERRFSK